MDVHMPDMDGLEATRMLRGPSESRDTPIVALTASADEDSIQACIDSSWNAHRAKPIQSANPFTLLQRYLGRSE